MDQPPQRGTACGETQRTEATGGLGEARKSPDECQQAVRRGEAGKRGGRLWLPLHFISVSPHNSTPGMSLSLQSPWTLCVQCLPVHTHRALAIAKAEDCHAVGLVSQPMPGQGWGTTAQRRKMACGPEQHRPCRQSSGTAGQAALSGTRLSLSASAWRGCSGPPGGLLQLALRPALPASAALRPGPAQGEVLWVSVVPAWRRWVDTRSAAAGPGGEP